MSTRARAGAAPASTPAPAPAPARSARGRRSANNPPPTTAATAAAAAAAAVDIATAAPVLSGKKVEDLGAFAELGVARTRVLDSNKVVFPSGQVLEHMTDVDIRMEGMQLAGVLPAVPGETDFGSAMKTLQLSGSAAGGVGAAAFKRKVELGKVGTCLLTLALSCGALRVTTNGFFILPSQDEVRRLITPAVPAFTSPEFQEAISKQVAICMTGRGALGVGAGASAGASAGTGVGANAGAATATAAAGSGNASSAAPLTDPEESQFVDMISAGFTDPEVCVRVCVCAGVCLMVECLGGPRVA